MTVEEIGVGGRITLHESERKRMGGCGLNSSGTGWVAEMSCLNTVAKLWVPFVSYFLSVWGTLGFLRRNMLYGVSSKVLHTNIFFLPCEKYKICMGL